MHVWINRPVIIVAATFLRDDAAEAAVNPVIKVINISALLLLGVFTNNF